MKVFFRSIHLYLSLAAGLVIGLVCLTGAALVFEKEFQAALYPERYRVEAGAKRMPLDQLVAEVQQNVPDAQVTSVKVYDDPNRTVELNYAKEEAKQKAGENAGAPGEGKGDHGKKGGKGGGSQAFLNPYTGQIVGMSEGRMPFFSTMFSLHRWLLLDDTGKLIVGCSTLMFLFIILTGLILWWPKKMKILKQRLKLKWNAGWKRINHDLHLVVGFYTAVFLFIFAFTGLAWSFEWFNDGIYTLTGSENIRPEPPKSSVQEAGRTISFDEAFAVAKAQLPNGEYYTLNKPGEAEEAFAVTTMSKNAVHERASDQLFLDQYTGRKIGQNLYQERNLGQRVRATFYPVHVGSIAGMPGRIIAFLSCIAGFTFPITGFILWINRLKKNRKKARKKVYLEEAV